MYIFEIISLLFKKVGITKQTLDNILKSISNIPTALKYVLSIVIAIGIIYCGYLYIYQQQLNGVKKELELLHQELEYVVSIKDYSNDIFYIITALKTTEEIQKYSYEEEQLRLELIRQFISKLHPNDPLLYDIDAMIKRNKFFYDTYKESFNRTLENCKTIYKKDSVFSIDLIYNKYNAK